jgi:ribonuclease HI
MHPMSWERRRYRGNKAWVEVDAQGRLVLDSRGLAQLRYKPDDERTYTVRPEEVLALEAGPPEAEQAAADAGAEPIRIYTDGASSGNPGPAGLGAVLLWRDRRREIRRYLHEATNNVAELTAVLAALEAVRRPELPVRLHTDSEYVIGVLAEGHKVKANADLVARIRRQMERFPDLRFVKVPAHAGVPENERADALARAAIRERGPT